MGALLALATVVALLALGGTIGRMVAGLAVIVLFVALGRALGGQHDRLWSGSVTDPVTRVWSRRFFEARLAAELSRAQRRRWPISLLVIDVDQLKALNDVGGHRAGDRALRLVGESLRHTCRSQDLAARWGGDEFVVLAPRTAAAEAEVLAGRIQEAVRRLSGAGPDPLPFTVSIGIADLECAGGQEPDGLFAAADRALYQAKSQGRDRVVVAPARVSPHSRRFALVKES